MHQHLKVKNLVAATYASVPTLPPAEAKLMREVATRLSVTFAALTESLEQQKALCKERDLLNQQVVNLAVENSSMLRLLTDISENHGEFVNEADDYMHASVPLDYVSEINMYVSRDVNAENPFIATDIALANIQAMGVEKYGNRTIKIGEEEQDQGIVYAGQQALLFATQLRNGATV